MRRFLLAAMIFGAASGAEAADLPFLRGSFTDGLTTARVNWQGYYIGGQAGYGSSDENFNGSTSNMTAALLANTTIESEMQVSRWNLGLGKQSARSSGFGGFVGYNSQWDDVVIGVEASYLHGAFGGSTSASQSLVSSTPLSDGFYHAVTATSSSAIAVKDMATLRARAGYAYGSFLPYLFGGVALGNADITRSVTVNDHYALTFANAVASCAVAFCATLSATQAQHNHLVYGYSAGLGVDVNLIGGLFMRAEWEYLRFSASTDTSINTVRAGLGYKF
ncbi:outer membrane beta-barrel protein [Bradyrhizobium sediminis]|uniref:Outer membrane beta-barrel protein n=1 Tax=Bradyrhizobium sediminis TaxID=2840469 RepID=A0A975NMX7_9BRAD|nr:outer membrane beta-barrel protein [Bradyrhizobium sediminis]QWG17501.1 outer membrane beta-barrel protein [Bradyrhizobium sediminis]